MNLDSTPPFWLRNAMVQSTLGSRGKGGPVACRADLTLAYLFRAYCPQEGRDVRLLGTYDLQPSGDSHERRLAILIHGWEGSASSAYVLRMARELYDHGWDVFRLNLRDHGPTHHLNEGLFNGSLIDEVYSVCIQAVQFWQQEVQQRNPRVIVAGFSMGGNFAIRIAGSHSVLKNKIPGLTHCYAISPAVHPEKTTALLDSHPVLSHYFLRKWFESLKLKEKLFPDIYDFGRLSEAKSVMSLTDKVVRQYSHYQDASHYFQSYTIEPQHAGKINIPLSILTAADDPIIAPDELRALAMHPDVNLTVTQYGGQVYINGLKRPIYLDFVEH